MSIVVSTFRRPANQQQIVLWSSWLTYSSYYLCRFNMSVVKTPMCAAFSWNAQDMGVIFTAFLLTYAVGQFVNGQIADRLGARLVASLGIFGSIVSNLAVFLVVLTADLVSVNPKRVLLPIVILWMANGFFQAMGWPSMVRLMAHWFTSGHRGKVMGLLGTSFPLGAAFSWLTASFLAGSFKPLWAGNWHLVFVVPAVMFGLVGMAFFLLVRDYPKDSQPLPICPVQKGTANSVQARCGSILTNILATLGNSRLWIVAAVFFLLNMNRYGFVNWLPAYLDAQRTEQSMSVVASMGEAMKLCVHPLSGAAGAVMAGWATDRYFSGRCAPVVAILLLTLGTASILFPFVEVQNTWQIIVTLALIGFCTAGPHILLVGHAAQDFSKMSYTAGAVGLIEAVGYVGASIAGWGAGVLIDSHGYDTAFSVFGLAAILGALLISSLWRASPSDSNSCVSQNT